MRQALVRNLARLCIARMALVQDTEAQELQIDMGFSMVWPGPLALEATELGLKSG